MAINHLCKCLDVSMINGKRDPPLINMAPSQLCTTHINSPLTNGESTRSWGRTGRAEAKGRGFSQS